MLLLAASLAVSGAVHAIAASDAPEIIVAHRILLEADTETPFPIHIKHQDRLPKNSFLRIRGNLAGLRLSQGHRVSEHTWAVPLGLLPQLTMAFDGRLGAARPLRVLLVALEGTAFRTYSMSEVTIYGSSAQVQPAEGAKRQTVDVMRATSSLPAGSKPAATSVTTSDREAEERPKQANRRPAARAYSSAAPSPAPAATPRPSNSPSPAHRPAAEPAPRPSSSNPAKPPPPQSEDPPQPTPALAPAKRAGALAMMKRGTQFFNDGNVEGARMFFRRAARIGLPEAAMAMAETYDPVALRDVNVLGLQPDIAQARTWYETARKLGAPDAEERLNRLEAETRQ